MATTTEDRTIRPGAYPEFTWAAFIVGLLLGVLIAISIGYASLILGFSIEGSELAAILGFGILRGILNRKSIIENNINQTIASAVNGASSGMMFSVPALYILGYTNFNLFAMVVGCIVGAVLGVCFIIPLRKQMIDYNRLAFPGGIAVAAVLKSPGAGMKKARLMLIAAGLSGLVHLVVYQLMGFSNAPIGHWLGMPDYMNGLWYVSLLTVGAGFLSGRGGVFFVVGGFICYWVLGPFLHLTGNLPDASVVAEFGKAAELPEFRAMPEYMRIKMFRPLGIGMLIGGALTGIALALPLVMSAVRSMQRASKIKGGSGEDEMPIRLLYFAVAGSFIVLLVIGMTSTSEIGFVQGGAMALVGTLWIWVAGVILSECIGRTNWSPLSGMTLIGVTILLFVARGAPDSAAIVSAVMVGAAMCVAMSQATDMMMDLKTGYLVGAIPKKQQLAQLAGVWLGPIVIMGLIYILHQDKGLGSAALPAPQGKALASMIEGITGGNVPLHQYGAGAGLGAILSASGIGGLGILVGLGFYMPFNIVLTYTIGTITRLVSDWKKGKAWSEETGIPIAAGLLVGEALIGVGFAVYNVFGGGAGGGH